MKINDMPVSEEERMLRYAALAAGVEVIGYNVKVGLMRIRERNSKSGFKWNPLTDDGDAFKLFCWVGASELLHTVEFRQSSNSMRVFLNHREISIKPTVEEAMRYNIVWIAAEEGRKKEEHDIQRMKERDDT